MHVDAEAFVAPDDVPQDLVVPPVVRRVDDPLVLPSAPGMRAGRREPDVEAADELGELLPALRHLLGDLRKRRTASRLDLDLGGDQLADEVLVELGARGGALELLEAIRQLERLRIDELELLLDRDREVLPVLEGLAGGPDLLVRGQALSIAHVASVNEAIGAARRRSTSSSAPRRRGA